MNSVRQAYLSELFTHLYTTLLTVGKVEFSKDDEDYVVTVAIFDGDPFVYKASRAEVALEKALRALTTVYEK